MQAGKSIKILVMCFIAVAAWFGLVLQFYLLVDATRTNGQPISLEILRYFSYFTILTNLLVATSLTCLLLFPSSKAGQFFLKPAVQAGIALYIGVVGLVYVVALAHIWNPTGRQLIADQALHYVVPFFYILYWAFFVPKKGLRWKHALIWLSYPAVYLVYVLIRGEILRVYPYHFIDKTLLNWTQMITNISVLLAVFAGLGCLLVGISKLFEGEKSKSRP